VVIPGVNDQHLPEVSRRLRTLGVFLQNVMPLISAPEHGTHYGLTGQRGPTAAELEAVQQACEVDSRIMRHCRQCRADAVGMLSEDRSAEFTVSALPPEPAQDASQVRAAHRVAVERVRRKQEAARREALRGLAVVERGLTARVAVATRGDGLVNQHFGHAREFLVYDVDRSGARLVAPRRVERYCRGGEGEEEALPAVLRALGDCQAVLVAMIGHCPRGQLAAAGIEPVMEFAHLPIEAAALGWFAGYAAKVAALPPRRWRPQGSAAIGSRAG
jgi:nitrogen fixation protein NifB